MKVTRIIDAAFKTGVSAKTNKPWTMIKIEAEGKPATGFGPVSVGDEVDLTYNEQYKNYSFKVIGPQDIPASAPSATQPPVPVDSQKILQLIYEDIQQILKLVDKSRPSSLSETWKQTTGQTPTPVQDVVVEDIGDGPIDLSDIPF